MAAVIVAVVFIAASLFAVLPLDFGPNWGDYFVNFLKGAAPFLGFLIGIIALIVGIADIKDKALSRKEEKSEENENNQD